MKKSFVHPPGFAAARGTYSPAVVIETGDTRLLFATGQLAVDVAGNVVAPGEVAAQTEYVFQLIGEILATAGFSFDDVVRAQTYLTNIADFPQFSLVRNRYLGGAMAASTLLEVKGLARPGCVVEIEITAAR